MARHTPFRFRPIRCRRSGGLLITRKSKPCSIRLMEASTSIPLGTRSSRLGDRSESSCVTPSIHPKFILDENSYSPVEKHIRQVCSGALGFQSQYMDVVQNNTGSIRLRVGNPKLEDVEREETLHVILTAKRQSESYYNFLNRGKRKLRDSYARLHFQYQDYYLCCNCRRAASDSIRSESLACIGILNQ